MAGYGTPLGYGEGLYGETFIPGGEGTVLVELDDGSGTFPHDITGYVLKADGITFSRGRQDWQSGVSAGDISMTLNNSDGRFTVGSTVIATPSPIKVDHRIRFRETVNGTTFTRFTGYVKQWPVAWPATVATYAQVKLMATDAQARAERRVLRSWIEEEARRINAYAFFPMTEASGAEGASDTISGANYVLTPAGDSTAAAPVFGGSLGLPFNDGGVTFAAGQYLSVAPGLFGGSTATLMAAFNTTTAGSGNSVIARTQRQTIGLDVAGHVTGVDDSLTSTTVVTDGKPHVVMYVRAPGNASKLYVDGVIEANGTVSGADSNTRFIRVGENFTGTVGRVLFSYTDQSANAAALSKALLTGFPDETGGTRLSRIVGYAGLTSGTIDTSLTYMAGNDVAGQSAWDAIQAVVEAEMGVAFIDENGALEFHNRNHTAAKTSPDLTLDSTSYLTPDAEPTQDDQQILNYIEVASAQTGVPLVVRDGTSEGTHGRYAESRAYLVRTNDEALDRANWIVTHFAEPFTRFGTLTLNLWAMDAATAESVLSTLEIGSWLRVTGFPSQTPGGTTVDVVVEGYSEHISSNAWTLTLNVSDKSLTDCLILDDPVRGVLDAGYRLYV